VDKGEGDVVASHAHSRKADMANEQQTGTKDKHYNLTSVLYHALQGGEVYDQYISDAEADGDDELAQFFRDVQQEEADRAERAKGLLGDRLTSDE
jgi:hypothetical protein